MNQRNDIVITRHPQNKKGIKMDREVYLAVATLMMQQIAKGEEVTLAALIRTAETQLAAYPDIVQLVYHVKLDLEAKGYIRLKASVVEANMNVLRLTAKGRKHKKLPASLLEL